MPSLEAKRTLVKSPPEIWAEVSDAGTLARHLGEFGEIRITRTQPESVVEWEGDLASGCVRLEPSGWGTKVTLTAEAPDPPEPEPEPVAPEPQPEPESVAPEPVVTAPAKRSWWSRLWRRGEVAPAEPVVVAPEPEPVVVEPEPEPVVAEAPPPAPVLDPVKAEAALTGVLDTLGAAHHRPFSRG